MSAGWLAGHVRWVGGWASQLGEWLGMPSWVVAHARFVNFDLRVRPGLSSVNPVQWMPVSLLPT